MVSILGKNSKPFWSMSPRRVTKNTRPSEGLNDIGHSISIDNLILEVNSVTVSYLILYDSLLQNAADIITKSDGYFIIKCDRSLLQNVSSFILQNATEVYYKMHQVFYYKMRQLLQIATVQGLM